MCIANLLTSYSSVELRSQILNDEITKEITMLLYEHGTCHKRTYTARSTYGHNRQCFHACRECTNFHQDPLNQEWSRYVFLYKWRTEAEWWCWFLWLPWQRVMAGIQTQISSPRLFSWYLRKPQILALSYFRKRQLGGGKDSCHQPHKRRVSCPLLLQREGNESFGSNWK